MRKIGICGAWRLGAIALTAIVLTACGSPTGSDPMTTSRPTESATPAASPTPTATDQMVSTARLPNLQTFTTDELFKVGAGGCGMTLWRSDRAPTKGQFLFFNGIKPDSAWMKIDGKMVPFNRTAATGQEFYGQAPSQTFTSKDGTMQVNVTVKTGEKGYEGVAIAEGTLRFQQGVNDVTIPVKGGAGC